ncbi:MAG: hypothetical protein V4663_04965 [Bacteroidota bacterium]
MTRVNYGVASSPAFELLPGKVSEVTHLTSAHDLYANFSTLISGKKLNSGLAVDARPFAFASGDLDAYQKNYFRRLLWRTSLSVGTTPGSENKEDVFLAAGLRFTLIDQSDPRSNKDYIDELSTAYLKVLESIPPKLGESAADLQKRIDDAVAKSPEIKAKREGFTKKYWNATRWDLGLGVSSLAASGFLKTDSIFKDRLGVWSAFSTKLGKHTQLVFSGQTSVVSHKADTTERNRSVLGARARFFFGEGFAASTEYAQIFSNYKDTRLNENWGHLALILEFKIPKLGGWASIAYGGDATHRTETGAKFSFSYAVYTDRILKKN